MLDGEEPTGPYSISVLVEPVTVAFTATGSPTVIIAGLIVKSEIVGTGYTFTVRGVAVAVAPMELVTTRL